MTQARDSYQCRIIWKVPDQTDYHRSKAAAEKHAQRIRDGHEVVEPWPYEYEVVVEQR